MSSIDMVGVVMAGWSSHNKHSLIGGLRSAAQMISYELPLVLALVGVVMLTSILANSGIGTISIKEMIDFQSSSYWPGKGIPFWNFIFQGFTPWVWYFLVQPFMLLIYYICGVAETNHAPFDLPEAESELVAGYLTEYSGFRWVVFYLGEYGNMTIVSAIATTLFLGGWSGPGVAFLTAPGMAFGWQLLGNILGIDYFILNVYLLCFVFIWVRSTLPRLRADQLMQFAWLILIPVTLGNILITALVYLILNSFGLPNLVFLIVLGAVNFIMLGGFIWLISRATLATTRHAQAPAIRAQRRAADAAQQPERAGVASSSRK
jgi:NADH-quinone oxidoreductase subunit H